MCSNYRPVTKSDRLLKFFGVAREKDELPVDTWPLGLAPFIRLAEPGSGNKIVGDGQFGLLAHFDKELSAGRHKYNARAETVATKVSYRTPWAKGMRCIIPAECFYENDHETGEPVRWRIKQPFDIPMGIAGIYWPWKRLDGWQVFTFAMITVNADGHPVMSRFHPKGHEKRMVVILHPDDYDAWLTCSVQEAPQFFKQWMEPLETEPAPLPKRAPRVTSGKVTKPTPPAQPENGSLF